MAKYNQKFWKNEYSKKENIIKWFKEIKEIIEKEKEQKQIFELVKNIILKEI